MKLAAAAAALLVVVLAALVLVSAQAPKRELTSAELAWVRTFVAWREDRWRAIAVAYDDLGGAPAPERMRELAEELGACSESLARDVGPSPRILADVSAAARDACSAAERSVELVFQAGDAGLAEARGALLEADGALVRSDARLDRRLLVRRELPVIQASSMESRVDARLSQAATAVSGVPMSVRCWSPSDWPRARRELASLVERESAQRLRDAGVWGGDPSLSPGICAALASISSDAVAPVPSGLARALRVLGREVAYASGALDEVEAACGGLQLVGELATRLGASPETADELAAIARRSSSSTVTCPPSAT